MFRLKEVAPIKTKNTFWTRDLRTAREANREQKVFAGADAKVLQDGLRAALKLQASKGGDKASRPNAKRQVQGGSGYAPSPLESQLTMSTASMLRRGEGGANAAAEQRAGGGMGLLGLFVREKDARGADNYLTDNDDDITSSTGSAGDLLKEVRFQGLENMADLLFDDVDEVDGDEEGFFLEDLFETSKTYTGSERGIDHKEIALSIRGGR